MAVAGRAPTTVAGLAADLAGLAEAIVVAALHLVRA